MTNLMADGSSAVSFKRPSNKGSINLLSKGVTYLHWLYRVQRWNSMHLLLHHRACADPDLCSSTRITASVCLLEWSASLARYAVCVCAVSVPGWLGPAELIVYPSHKVAFVRRCSALSVHTHTHQIIQSSFRLLLECWPLLSVLETLGLLGKRIIARMLMICT